MGITTIFVRPLGLMPFILFICFTIMNLVFATPNITTHHHPPAGELVVETTSCIEHERQALLQLKQGMTDYDGVLASWGSSTNDCCMWRGVGCSNRTGHVIKLQLKGRRLSFTAKGFGGVINSSLLGLSHLKVLDLSNNNFTEITQSISSLVNLQYLNLRYSLTYFSMHAHNLGNLSNLQFLDLRGTNAVVIDNMKWLSNLSSLKYLDLSRLILTRVTHWFDEISPLFPSLVQLKMSDCGLSNTSYTSTRASLFIDQGTNFNLSKSQLAVLDLSDNDLDASSIYPWLLSNKFSRSSMVHIDLSFNNLQGPIHEAFGAFTLLEHLDLSFTKLEGGIPRSFGNLSNLQYLDLSITDALVIDNLKWLSNLSSLKYLDLSHLHLTKVTHWFDEISPILPSLIQLKMSFCYLPNINYTSTRASLILDQGTNFNLSKSRLAVLDLSFNFYLLASSIYPLLLSNNFSRSSMIRYIDLNYNNLQGPIPEAFGAFTLLEYLDLSSNELEGGIPSSFGNLSHLRRLDLSFNHLDGQLPFVFSNLSGCAQSSLEVLKLEYNGLSGSLPDFTSFSSLEELILIGNQLNGSFPERFGGISKLSNLDVSGNRITGSLPDLSAFSDSLTEFRLYNNRLTGVLPESIGQLSKLEVFSASENFLQGTLTESHLTNLSRLLCLDISFNNLSWGLSSDWTPPFLLNYLGLSSIILGPSLPEWIRTQNSLYFLDISSTGISGVAPNWIWDLTPTLYYLNLSSNRIEGVIPNLSFMSSKSEFTNDKSYAADHILATFPQTSTIDLSSNNFSGKIPLAPSNTRWLDLSNNNFSESISFLCSLNLLALNYLDLSNNHLSGKIPDCWMNSKYLQYLNLENNKLTGRIPESMGSLVNVGVLNMGNNNLTGELPSSLRNCVRLQLVDLRENRLKGLIPKWIGESMSRLIVFSLGTNRFHGTMPLSFCHLPLLQILDLSVNKISGSIPECLKNLSAMGQIGSQHITISNGMDTYTYMNLEKHKTTSDLGIGYVLETMLLWKGRQYEYKNTLGLVKILDLSSNNFSGKIPNEITSLVGLVALNLSRNNITGPIPSNIGNMGSLDFLDLSRNHLVGKIPESLGQISRLSMLDVSYNNLSGRIPTGTQLQGYNASVYMGNPSLCGPPLTKKCPESGGEAIDPNNRVSDIDDEDQLITREFYFGLVFGFGFGFWGVIGTLLLRGSYKRFLSFEAGL